MFDLLSVSQVWPLLSSAALVILGLMLIVTAIANPLKNAGIVDVAWAFGFSLIAGTYFALGQGAPVQKTVMLLMVTASSWRLAWYLLKRVIATHPEEDGRYHALRELWGPEKSPWLFFAVYLFQGVLMLIVSSPFLFAAQNPSPTLSPLQWVAMVVWAVGLIFEAVADQQLKRFKDQPENKGKVCQSGLWAYSRHPNYFFEWLQWMGYYLLALGAPGGWTTIYSPMIMLLFLTRFSGVAATEAQALKTKGEAYRRYQESTSPFVPWFPKRKPS